MKMKPNSRADHWTRRAGALGYPARSIFKLEEMQRKWKLLRPGKRVLDVGAAPGSWTLYALRHLGKGAEVSAVDLKPLGIQPPGGTHLRFFQGDVFSDEAAGFLAEGGPFGCILSDAAPSTSGSRVVDCRRSFDLVMRVIDLGEEHLESGGSMVVKVFQGGDEGEIHRKMESVFREIRVFRPRAVRSRSMEIYMIGRGFTQSRTLEGSHNR